MLGSFTEKKETVAKPICLDGTIEIKASRFVLLLQPIVLNKKLIRMNRVSDGIS